MKKKLTIKKVTNSGVIVNKGSYFIFGDLINKENNTPLFNQKIVIIDTVQNQIQLSFKTYEQKNWFCVNPKS